MANIRIRIVTVPPGEALEWVQQKWVGLEFPVASIPLSKSSSSIQTGVKFGKPENFGGYPVETKIAIRVLKEKSPEAAQWWEENIHPAIMPWLVFKKEVCDLV